MTMKWTIVTGLSAASLVLASALAFAAGQYGPGVGDTAVKTGNTVPYSGPASSYGTIGKPGAAYLKDRTDPQWQDTPEYKEWLVRMKKYNSSGNVADIGAAYGYGTAQTMVAVLKASGERARQPRNSRTDELPSSSGASVSKPLIVSIPHRLGKREALHRLKSGLDSIRRNYGFLFTVQEETWTDYHLQFRVSVLGQAASGRIDVTDDHVYLEAFLPWLLAKLAEAAKPLIRREGVLMLERK